MTLITNDIDDHTFAAKILVKRHIFAKKILVKHIFYVALHRSWAIKTSSRQRELDAQAEILRCSRITAARQERGVGLTVIIETHGKEFAEGIIGRETQFQSIVAAAGTAYH